MALALGPSRRVIAWAAVLLCAGAMAGAVHAQPRAEVLTDPAQILKRFPADTALLQHGARVRLKNGAWIDVTDNPFGKSAPTLCWYAPALHLAGLCLNGDGVMVTTLVELNSGRRVSAPGRAALSPDPSLILVGPDAAHGVETDSVTLVRIEPNDLIDEGGAQFDRDVGPGAWVDADCYRLSDRTAKGGAWLERTATGWQQAAAAQSTVCQSRHGR